MGQAHRVTLFVQQQARQKLPCTVHCVHTTMLKALHPVLCTAPVGTLQVLMQVNRSAVAQCCTSLTAAQRLRAAGCCGAGSLHHGQGFDRATAGRRAGKAAAADTVTVAAVVLVAAAVQHVACAHGVPTRDRYTECAAPHPHMHCGHCYCCCCCCCRRY
jgi:hypothetical protein